MPVMHRNTALTAALDVVAQMSCASFIPIHTGLPMDV